MSNIEQPSDSTLQGQRIQDKDPNNEGFMSDGSRQHGRDLSQHDTEAKTDTRSTRWRLVLAS